MTAVARVLPRHWDGHRLLRFLAGLAMLALAFTIPAPAEPPAPVVVSITASETTTSVAVSESAPATSEDVRRWAATRPAEIRAVLALGSLVILIGATLRIRGERAPPAI